MNNFLTRLQDHLTKILCNQQVFLRKTLEERALQHSVFPCRFENNFNELHVDAQTKFIFKVIWVASKIGERDGEKIARLELKEAV